MLLNVLAGIAATLGAYLLLLLVAVLRGGESGVAIFVYGSLTIPIASAIYAAIETRRLRFHNYAMSFPRGPTTALLFVALFAIIAIPWFVATLVGIKRGTFRKLSESSR